MVATTRPQQHSVEAFPPAVLVAYVSRSNPWSLSLRNLLCCVPRFFREEDCIFLRVFVEDMTFTEQMHHRLSSVPAMKLYTKVLATLHKAYASGFVICAHGCCWQQWYLALQHIHLIRCKMALPASNLLSNR